ncbi:peptide deformylase [Streptomyces sp. NPDC048489]|uniref:peptide deformylase n=1 Tax=Streptomyces sp. NPDC048489 TaxID=3154504 RepID=UPI003432F359
MEGIAQVHPFAKGMGIAAPQIGIGRAAAVVQPPADGASAIVLLNPRVTDADDELDAQFEGCLSFFDVRGLVPRPLRITVDTTIPDGTTVTTVYEPGPARLIAHEIDTLTGCGISTGCGRASSRSPSRSTDRPAARGRTSGESATELISASYWDPA